MHFVAGQNGQPAAECRCGGHAWFATRLTIFEWIGYRLRYHRDTDKSTLISLGCQLGGTTEYMSETSKVIAEEVRKHEQQRS